MILITFYTVYLVMHIHRSYSFETRTSCKTFLPMSKFNEKFIRDRICKILHVHLLRLFGHDSLSRVKLLIPNESVIIRIRMYYVLCNIRSYFINKVILKPSTIDTHLLAQVCVYKISKWIESSDYFYIKIFYIFIISEKNSRTLVLWSKKRNTLFIK